MAIDRFEQLRVFQRAFEASMQIFEQSQSWPREERYALTDQIRRSSRSVSANIAEAWRKRRYPRHFVSELSDADAEAAETRVWLRYARTCGYLAEDEFRTLDQAHDAICGGLVTMMQTPEKWCGPSNLASEDTKKYHV